MIRFSIEALVTAAIATATALAILAIGGTRAHALPCLGKLERGADHYRLVKGQKCWYVGDEVPDKSEFKVKRKEVVPSVKANIRTTATTPAAAMELAPLRALAQASDDWLTAERPDYLFEALCGDACGTLAGLEARPAPVPERIRDAFEDLTLARFGSYPLVALRVQSYATTP